MEYQDQKIKAIVRLTIVAVVMTVMLALCVNYSISYRTSLKICRPGCETNISGWAFLSQWFRCAGPWTYS